MSDQEDYWRTIAREDRAELQKVRECNAKLVAALYIAKAAILTRREDSEAMQVINEALTDQQSTEKP